MPTPTATYTPTPTPTPTSTPAVSGNVVTFPGSFTIPLGSQIRVTPAIALLQPITVGGTTLSPFDNTTNSGGTTYFNFGPSISVN